MYLKPEWKAMEHHLINLIHVLESTGLKKANEASARGVDAQHYVSYYGGHVASFQSLINQVKSWCKPDGKKIPVDPESFKDLPDETPMEL